MWATQGDRRRWSGVVGEKKGKRGLHKACRRLFGVWTSITPLRTEYEWLPAHQTRERGTGDVRAPSPGSFASNARPRSILGRQRQGSMRQMVRRATQARLLAGPVPRHDPLAPPWCAPGRKVGEPPWRREAGLVVGSRAASQGFRQGRNEVRHAEMRLKTTTALTPQVISCRSAPMSAPSYRGAEDSSSSYFRSWPAVGGCPLCDTSLEPRACTMPGFI